MSLDRLHAPLNSTTSGTSPLVETRFIPRQYEPNYAYPLLVLLAWSRWRRRPARAGHARVELAELCGAGLAWAGAGHQARPAGRLWLGRRVRASRSPTRPAARHRSPKPKSSAASCTTPSPRAFDRLEEAVFTAILQTRRLLHVHSERIFLVGCGEGAAVAYWLGLTFPRAVRRRGRDQRLAPGRPAAAGPGQGVPRPARPGRARRLERQGPPS